MSSDKINDFKKNLNQSKKRYRIIITTFNKAHNYGAMLQEYALLTLLESEKYNVNVLNYNDKDIAKNYKYYGLGNGTIMQRIKTIIKYTLLFKKNKKRYYNFERFENEYINLTSKYDNVCELNGIKTDILITGSDQVWNFQITNGLSDVYTLNFGPENIRRISYAASIGVKKIPRNLQNCYTDKISKIDKISVREESAKSALSPLLKNRKIDVVLDPTLLLSNESWLSVIHNVSRKPPKEKYILAYVVEKDDEYFKIVNYMSEITGLKVVHFDKIGIRYKNVLENRYTGGPDEFISLIKNAEYVIATSFHATAFSIIFNKKFWVVPHKTTGSRVTDLLKKLDISNRAVNSLEEFEKLNFDEDIDYENVNKILEKEREKSINWLIDAIEK